MSKAISVIRFSSLGDIVMTIPVLYSFYQEYQESRIDFYTKEKFSKFIDLFPFINGIYWDEEQSEFSNYIELRKEICKSNSECIIDLHNVIRSRVLVAFSLKSNYKIDKKRAEKKELILLKEKVLKQLQHRVYDYKEVFNKAGFEFDIVEAPYLNYNIQKSSTIKIGIAPFSKHKSKEYNIDSLIDFVELMNKNGDYEFSIFGNGKVEKNKAYKLLQIENTKDCFNLSSIKDELKEMLSLDLMISMDSANGHLASLVGTPVLTLWGTTHYCLGYYPFNNSIDNSLFPDKENYPYLPVSVYGKCTDDYYQNSINSITVEQLVSKTKEILAK